MNWLKTTDGLAYRHLWSRAKYRSNHVWREKEKQRSLRWYHQLDQGKKAQVIRRMVEYVRQKRHWKPPEGLEDIN